MRIEWMLVYEVVTTRVAVYVVEIFLALVGQIRVLTLSFLLVGFDEDAAFLGRDKLQDYKKGKRR